VGTRGYCKNFQFAVHFLAESIKRGFNYPLLVAGGAPFNKKEMDLMKSLDLTPEVICHLGAVSNSQLRTLYSNCIALLIPSIYEGFGLPAAEAARCGALVLSARGSALDEIVGDTEYAFDLADEREISRVFDLGMFSRASDEARAEMNKRSLEFNWDASVVRLEHVYESL
jgi:mannosyltransferase